MGIFKYIMGGDNRRHINKLKKLVVKINELEPRFEAMTDSELKGMTDIFKKRYADGETLDNMLFESYAVVREAAKRVIGQRHYDVQLMGGIVLHQGRIAEMKTGEGKTLTETLPSYLNAIAGKGVHVVSVNEYLAHRDAEWMGKIHKFLGLTVGYVGSNMPFEVKKAAYDADITYGTNNEFGFDYLRDNMVVYESRRMQRGHTYCIIDEVDSILIDEARTPLIISGKGKDSSSLYKAANTFVRRLRESTNVDTEGKPTDGEEANGDFEVDLKKRVVSLTNNGLIKAERDFGVEDLTDADNSELNHFINNALRANFVMKKDVDYIVKDGEIIIVDEFTGRLMHGRRFNEGLHQAIEAKENVKIQGESKTMATVTFQNYFRLYKKLAGMTGTAMTEDTEFKQTYGLDVVAIPPNLPSKRKDQNDQIFASDDAKMRAIIRDIVECAGRGQPVLVGTTNIEKSEEVSKLLRREKIPHNVLNAKNHEKEADIVAQAGRRGAVTIATNMAGRGTDILLGGNAEHLARKKMKDDGVAAEIVELAVSHNAIDPAALFDVPSEERQALGEEIIAAREKYNALHSEFKAQTDLEKNDVLAVGGLRIIGTERHESRRIDNQLRGRAGRQGDIGSSVFYLSIDDDMLKIFGGERFKSLIAYISGEDEMPIDSRILTNTIEGAQKRIEGMNYSRRRNVLEYDNVLNRQREIIYGERNKVLENQSVHDQIIKMMRDECAVILKANTNPKLDWTEWDTESLNRDIMTRVKSVPRGSVYFNENTLSSYTVDELTKMLADDVVSHFETIYEQAKEIGYNFEEYERNIFLRIIDEQWTDHIDEMHSLRRDVGMLSAGQQDPVVAYKKEGFELFDAMIGRIQTNITSHFARIMKIEKREEVAERKQVAEEFKAGTAEGSTFTQSKETIVKGKIPNRNDPCPCGAAYPDGNPKKYKDCHGADR